MLVEQKEKSKLQNKTKILEKTINNLVLSNCWISLQLECWMKQKYSIEVQNIAIDCNLSVSFDFRPILLVRFNNSKRAANPFSHYENKFISIQMRLTIHHRQIPINIVDKINNYKTKYIPITILHGISCLTNQTGWDNLALRNV